MTWLEKNRLISKPDKERKSNYFCSKSFLINIPFMDWYFEQFTNNEFLDCIIIKGFCSCFFTIFPFYTPLNYETNVFGEHKTGNYEETG